MSEKILSLVCFDYEKTPETSEARWLYLTQETEKYIKGIDAQRRDWRTFSKSKIKNKFQVHGDPGWNSDWVLTKLKE